MSGRSRGGTGWRRPGPNINCVCAADRGAVPAGGGNLGDDLGRGRGAGRVEREAALFAGRRGGCGPGLWEKTGEAKAIEGREHR